MPRTLLEMFSVYLLVYVPLHQFSYLFIGKCFVDLDHTLKPPFSSEYGFLGMHF